jgi:hypothetical protein
MGNNNEKQSSNDDSNNEYHRRFSLIYKDAFVDQVPFDEVLNQMFPKRKIFCLNFVKWMEMLSYKKTVNRESFTFACEILSIDSEFVIKEEYRKHSFSHLDLFLHLSVQRLPGKINLINIEEASNYLDVFINFLISDDVDPKEAKDSLMGMILKRTEIGDKSIPHETLLKLYK